MRDTAGRNESRSVPAWEGYREFKRYPRGTSRHVSGGTRDAMGCTNSLGSMPVKCQGADASRDPADSPGKTRPLF